MKIPISEAMAEQLARMPKGVLTMVAARADLAGDYAVSHHFWNAAGDVEKSRAADHRWRMLHPNGLATHDLMAAAAEIAGRDANGGTWVVAGKIPDAIMLIIRAYGWEKDTLRVSQAESVVKSWAVAWVADERRRAAFLATEAGWGVDRE